MTLPTAAVVRGLYIPQLGTNTGEDSNLTTLIARADSVLAGWCGFPPASVGGDPTLESTTYTHYFSGPMAMEPRAVQLRVRPVASVTTVHNDINRDWAYGSDDLVSSSDYTLDGEEGRIYLHDDSTWGGWYEGPRRIKVVYVAGYDTGADTRITQGVSMLVAHWWQKRNMTGQEGLTVEGQGSVAVTDPPAIPDAVKEIMWPVRLPEVGMG